MTGFAQDLVAESMGAERVVVLRMVLQDGARMAPAGTAIGIVAALGLTRLMASMLFGVKPSDPITFCLVAVVLCAIALLAGYIAAPRAAEVDPMVAPRYE
jgi:putative ABC transport system permease protein